MNPVARKSVWLQRAPSPSVQGRVFCVPHAGCGTSVFRNWPQERAGIEFLAVELPGRLTRFSDPMPKTFQDLAAEMIEGLAPYLDVPFAFFGHCWSALIAYEATVALERSGGPRPAGLYVSSLMAPQDEVIGRLMTMNEAQLAEELGKTVRDMGSSPHPELVAIYADILRSDLDMSRHYIASDPGPLSCPISAFGWSDDSEVTPDQMTGWAECGETTLRVLPGEHNRIVDAPPELLDHLCSGLRAGR
ncbi:thioesterase II family protein [Micromonospora sp. DT68]|uniref:thioesterase II family protein n=1 Tax=Micromonospora TaxID=1873 RepID=UPI00339F5254